MASRPSRASSIPIPLPPSTTRSIDNAISIPTARTRGLQPASYATSPPTLARSIPRSSTSLSRTPIRQPFEPRVVRAPSLPSDLSSASLPSGHARRASTSAHPAGRSAPRVSLPAQPEASPIVLDPEPFPRPAYLDHSTFRDALRPEPPTVPPRKDASTAVGPSASYSAASLLPSDSDEDFSPPPRRNHNISTPATVVVTQPPQSVFLLPTKWSDTDRSNSLTISPDKRELLYAASGGDKDGAAARTDVPIPPACGVYYYEVLIRGKEQKSHITIGFAGPKVKFSCLPGFVPSSWGYYGLDGCSLSAQRTGNSYAQPFGSNDIIGCGIDFSTRRAFYTKNGQFLGNVFENVGVGIDLYPTVGLQVQGESIRVNFGHESFKFDIENHVQQQKSAAWKRIMTTPLYASVLNPGSNPSSSKGPLSDEETKVALNKLVLSYLIHHGYPKTVRAFLKQQDASPKSNTHLTDDVEMDISSPVKPSFSEGNMEDEIEQRTRIVKAVARGDIDLAITETEKYHPAVLKAEANLMLFKLRCRKFVELILETATIKKEMKQAKERVEKGLDNAEPGTAPTDVVEGDRREEDMDMDVDDDAGGDSRKKPLTIAPSARDKEESVRAGKQPADGSVSTTRYEAALQAALAYGQSLSNDYKSDTRPEVKQLFKQTFGIVAWEDPLAVGGDIARFVSVQARVELANELNQAILRSEGRPAQPALETVYRHTCVCISQLGTLGEGTAAFADLQREILDA